MGSNLIGCQTNAQEKRSGLIAAYERGAYSASTKSITIADAVAALLYGKRGVVRPNTFASYEFQARYVVGPLLAAAECKAIVRLGTGKKPTGKPLPLLGGVKMQELTTRQNCAWRKLVSDEASIYSADKAMAILQVALALDRAGGALRPAGAAGLVL